MLDAIVQFIRNALCCVKDLHLFNETFIHYSNYTDIVITNYTGIQLPEPTNQTTPLELLISITQLYACLSTSYSGISLMYESVGKLRRCVRLLELRLQQQQQQQDNNNNNTNFKHANRIVNESMIKEAKLAIRGIIIGFLVFPIGISFFWLFGNSWHMTDTDWIGGLAALIHALTVMEICLLPLLGYMIVDSYHCFTKRQLTKQLMDKIEDDAFQSPSLLTIKQYDLIHPEWIPFWERGSNPFQKPPPTTDEMKQIQQEVTKVEQFLNQLFLQDEDENKKKKKKKTDKDDNEKEDKIRLNVLEKAVNNMEENISTLRMKGYREIIYFILNSVAFYGYLMAIITYYFPDDTTQPWIIDKLKLGYNNTVADWTGNFAGDLMWTIEPMIILGSPFYFTYMRPPPAKKALVKNKVKNE